MEPLIIDDSLQLLEVGAFLPKCKTLVVADLQLGQEGLLREQGHNVLDRDAARIKAMLLSMLDATGASRIVIDGDLKHAFGQILPQERRDVREILGALKENADVVLVRGNHDPLTAPLARELGLALEPSWSDGETLVVHGHTAPDPTDPAYRQAKTIIIGHVHPAITLSDGVRAERVKCFLLTQFNGKRLVVLPSCTTLTAGADVLHLEPRGPFLDDTALERSRVYLTDANAVRDLGSLVKVRAAMERLRH